MKRKFGTVGKACLALLVGVSILAPGIGGRSLYAAEAEDIRFATQAGGVFDGMPLFDGNPQHLDQFVDAYFEYTGLEGPAVYATGSRNHYTLQRGTNAGKVIPGALSAANDGQGVSTDFPALVGMGQTWNKELISQIGQVIGDEKISTLKVKQGESNIHGGANASLSVAFTVISDIRINPLNGRFDEGFTEDPYLSSMMVNNLAEGIGGTDLPESEDGFWMRTAVSARHYSVYNSQWFRQNAENSAGPRAIFEYHAVTPLRAFEQGTLAGVMTSFGSTNGIPNILSPYQIYANQHSKYGVYSSPDFNADQRVFMDDSFGNGYDTKYATDRTHATVLMTLADANAGRPSPSAENGVLDVLALVDAVESGLYGITEADLIEAARPHVNQLVRIGIFNETDENGIPLNYPFAADAKDVSSSISDYNSTDNQEIALQAAHESIVLLKNDGVLPLAKEDNAALSGVYADSRFKSTYSVAVTPPLENSGMSPLSAIINKIGRNNVSYQSGVPIISLTSKLDGNTVAVDETEEGAQLITVSEPVDTQNSKFLFEQYDWGQEGKSLRALYNDRWVTSPGAANAPVSNTDETLLNLTSNDWDGALLEGDTSTIPPRLRIEHNADDSVSLITNGYLTGFGGNFTNWYYSNGRFVTSTEDGKLVTSSSTLGNASNVSNRSDAVKFEQTVVQEVGEQAAQRALEDDYAIVFVGAIPRHSAGEGYDRSSLNMGDADYELVNKVSAAFAEQGKKTVVVVTSSFPVAMEDIQQNENVSAIVYMPYAGQYDAYALANVLYGDYAPTGRLSSTWYADLSAFPTLNEYSIPEGQTAIQLDDIDPRYTVDMTNADPIESKLTYMYTDADVTYEFGYGLSYSDFEYGDLTAPIAASSEAPFDVTVEVTNTGSIDTSEVVQLYVKNDQSAYGSYAPKKQLVAFEKIQLAAGEQKTVTLTVNPKDFAVWDVNRGEFVVEDGSYSLMVGASSENIYSTQSIKIDSQSIATLTADSFNVFDHSFASEETIYNEISKARTAANLKDNKVTGGYYAVRSKQAGSWTAIPKVNLSNATKVTARVATNQAGGQITLHAGSPHNEAIATIAVPVTEATTYTLPLTEVEVTELDYVDVEEKLKTQGSGIHDLYVVFHAPDLRLDSLTFERASTTPPVTTPVVTDPDDSTTSEENNEVFIVTNPVINAEGAIQLELPASKYEAQVPANVKALEEATQLQVVTDYAQLTIPAEVLKQLQALLTLEELSEANLSIRVKPVEQETQQELLKQSSEQAQANVSTAGTMVDISIVLYKKNGQEAKLDEFIQPVTVKLAVNQSASLDLVAVYSISNSGEVAYDGGLLLNRWIETEANSNGKYAAIEFDKSFNDVPATHWAYAVIKSLTAKQVVTGMNAEQFAPNQPISRAQFTALIVRAIGLEAANATPFQDVNRNKWYADAVSAAYEAGIITGQSNNTFSPDTEITREEMAVIIMRAYNLLYGNNGGSVSASFNDQQSISAWAEQAVNSAVSEGLLIGKEGNRFDPQGLTTRAESAQVIYNLLASN